MALGEFLFADEMQRDAAVMAVCAVLPQIKPLPRPEHGPAGAHGNVQIYRRERSADVCGHIIVTFRRVDE